MVTLRVAIYHLNGSAPRTQKTFDAARGLISKFPVGIEEIHIDLLLCEQGDIYKMFSLEAMPWAGIDTELEAMQSTSLVIVEALTHGWPVINTNARRAVSEGEGWGIGPAARRCSVRGPGR